jgi:putative peptidoglycan lipid II flippase
MGPRIVGVAVVRLNFVINAVIATSLAAGSLTSINVAFMVMTMPQVVIAQAIAIAALPTFSAQVARGEIREMRSSLASTIRGVLLLAVPAMTGLILLRQPVVAMLFQRGNFTGTSTDMVSWALLWYSVGLVGHSMVEILVRAFYALHDTKTPVTITTIAMLFNVGFSFAFAALFSKIGWMPHGGLALANSLATALEMIGLLILIRRPLKGIDGGILAKGLAQAVLASLGMAIALLVWIQSTGSLNPWVVGLGGVAIGGLVYGLGVVLLKVPETQSVFSLVRKHLSGS